MGSIDDSPREQVIILEAQYFLVAAVQLSVEKLSPDVIINHISHTFNNKKQE